MRIPKHIRYLVGIDEAGRGPIAGPVALGAFCVSTNWRGFKKFSYGVKDSKKLTEKQREGWFSKMEIGKTKGTINFSVSFGSQETIDTKGLSFTICQALGEALSKLSCRPEETLVLLDGSLHAPKEFIFQETIIKGDDKIPVISLAAIAAKVTRDRYMCELSKKYPAYGFERHKGYGTREHYQMIEKYGILEFHRKSFLKNPR